MSAHRFVIESPFKLSLRRTAVSHGWVELAPWRWDDKRCSLSRTDRLPSGGVALIQVTQRAPRSFDVVVQSDDEGQVNEDAIRGLVARWLSIDWDPRPATGVASRLDSDIATYIEDGGGRFLRCSTFFEDFLKTVCTINISWSGTERMVKALIGEIGGGVFPTPLDVLRPDETRLKASAGLGFRTSVVIRATEELLGRNLMDEWGRETKAPITYEELIRLRGIGPYAASHLSMLLHDYSRIPVDSGVIRYCERRHGLSHDEIEPYFDQWGDQRYLGYKLGRIVANAN